jgi:hypothetical protein
MSKRPPVEELDAALAGDLMELTPLGAGQEVGRSCLYLTFKGKTVMVRGLSSHCARPPFGTVQFENVLVPARPLCALVKLSTFAGQSILQIFTALSHVYHTPCDTSRYPIHSRADV